MRMRHRIFCDVFYFCCMAMKTKIKLMKAMETMRHLSEHNIPFDIEFYSYNETTGKSEGLKKETKILLMPGYRRNQSSKHDILVSYLRTETNERRQFYLPLLMKLDEFQIKIM